MTTLKEAYDVYCKSEPHATIVEPFCLEHGCNGDVYRAQIQNLKKSNAEIHQQAVDWQHRAEKAEKQLNAVIDALKKNMIFDPTDNWQWGYRAGLISIMDVIHPEGEKNER